MKDGQLLTVARADNVLHKRLQVSNDFAAALAAHFALPADMVDAAMHMHTGPDEIFGVTLRIALTADDLAAIAAKMAEAKPRRERQA